MNRAPTSASNLARRRDCIGSEHAEAPFADKDSELHNPTERRKENEPSQRNQR